MKEQSQSIIKKFSYSLPDSEKGQSLIIFTFALVGLLGMLGLALDLGLVYIERVKINRATDAAALAAVVELPFEEGAMQRAIEYIELNGYDVGNDIAVYVRGCATDSTSGDLSNLSEVGTDITYPDIIEETDRYVGHLYVPTAPGVEERGRFVIDTGSFRPNDEASHACDADSGDFGTSPKIKVYGRIMVPMNFFRLPGLGGFSEVPVREQAIAENVSNLDVMVVMDVSGSMEVQTTCVDCWVKTEAWEMQVDVANEPFPNGNGYFNPIPYNTAWHGSNNSIPDSALCIPEEVTTVVTETVDYVIPTQVYTGITGANDYFYNVHEAEFYSTNNSNWELDSRQPGRGFWAIQRGSRGLDHPLVDNPAEYDLFQGNQVGNTIQQSANVCDPGIDDAGNDIDCKLGDLTLATNQNICNTAINGFGPIDCSAYIQARPYVTYWPERGSAAIGGAFDIGCFDGSGCWSSSPVAINVPPVTPVPYVEYDFKLKPEEWSSFTSIGGDDYQGPVYVWARVIGGALFADEWSGNPTPFEGENIPQNLGLFTERVPYQASTFWELGTYDDGGGGFTSWLNLSGLPQEIDVEAPGVTAACPGEDAAVEVSYNGAGIPSSPDFSTSPPIYNGTGLPLDCATNFPIDPPEAQTWRDNRAQGSDWMWVRVNINPLTLDTQTRYTLRVYQGSSGYKIDRFLFTNDPGDLANHGGSLIQNALTGKGLKISRGSANREACNLCNPIYGLQVNSSDCSCFYSPALGEQGLGCSSVEGGGDVNMLNDDLFNDIEPLRSAKEAVKNFIIRLDPRFDQVGFVGFGNDVINETGGRSKLQCRQYAAVNLGGVEDCYEGANPISYTMVLQAVENQWPLDGTDMGEGLREGLEELGVSIDTDNEGVDSSCSNIIDDRKSCSRSGAARRILVLLTDGAPSDYPGSPSHETDADAGDYCQTVGATYWDGLPDDASHRCAMFYAYQAYNHGVTLYTIGLGGAINAELLTAMATGTNPETDTVLFPGRGGKFYAAATPADLDRIFEEILSNIYVRIVG